MEGRPLDDSELIERSREGDRDAFGELVRRYQAVAFRIAYAITRSAAEAEDAAQEGFVKGYRAIDRFRANLERLGFFVCVQDLEDELVRAAGPEMIDQVMISHGDPRTHRGCSDARDESA